MTIGIVGMGLIGGSICRALKQFTPYTVLGTTRNRATVEFASSAGVLDGAFDDLSVADITFVALPPEATIDYLRSHVGQFKTGSIVTDICGVKGAVVSAVDRLYHDSNVHYIGGHPMAGKENSGFSNSDADLFSGASFVITPTEYTNPASLELLKDIILKMGFATIAVATPEEHDRNIAFTSQLAHVVSNAYVKSPTIENEFGFSAGSFLDLTRVAKLDEEMWASLFILNRDALLFEIDTLIQSLSKFRDSLSQEDRNSLVTQLRQGRLIKERDMFARREKK